VAQVFPLTAGDSAVDDAGAVLAETLAALPEEWTLLRARRIGDAAADGVLVHPGIGVALIDLAPEPPEAARAALRARLERERLSQFFPGELPIVAVGVTAEELESVGAKLQAAFEAAPSLGIADPDWADSVIELLLQPEDMAMAPVGASTTPEPTIPAPTSPRAELQRADPPREEHLWDEPLQQARRQQEHLPDERLFEERLQEARPRGERLQEEPPREDLWRRDPFQDEPPLDRRFYAAPLRAEYPPAYDLPRRRRPGRKAAIAVGALVVIGAAIAAWSLNGNDGIPTAVLRQAEIEVPLAESPPASAPASLPRETKTEPPPLPAAPPVLMAAKQMIEPPPPAPRPTKVAPLPEVVVQAAPPQPQPQPPPAATPAPAAPIAPPAREAAAAQPHVAAHKRPRPVLAEKKPSEAKPPREARTESPPEPKPQREARQEPNDTQQMMQRELNSDGSQPATSETGSRPPPIDADELPPLPPSSAPLARVPPPVPPPPPFPPPAAPAAQAAASAPVAAPSIQERAATGPPMQLVRQPAQAANGAGAPAASAATPQRECRPYTSTTTLTGNAVPVQGIACRDGDGPWRLVSEVPAR
jgi:periplasmic protein TonB